MAIQSDENGFLVGQTVDDIKRANKNTTAILKEVKDIKKLLSGIRSQQNQQRGQGQPPQPPQPDTQPPHPRQSRSNNSDSGNESNNNQRVNNRSEQVNNQQSNNANNEQLNNVSEQQPTVNNTGNNNATQNANNSGNSGAINTDDNLPPNTQLNDAPVRQETVEPNDSAAPRLRDANGRFIRNGEQQTAEPNAGRRRNSRGQFSSGDDSGKDTKGDSTLSGLFDGLGDRIATAIDAGNDLQEADPTVKAFQETVEPMAKGYRFVFGSGSAKDKPYFAWFKKIWKTLKNTEENTEEANRLNGTSILGALLTAAIVAFGVFSKDGQAFFGKLKEIFVDPVINWVKESSGYNKAVDWTSRNIIEPISPVIESLIQSWSAIFTNIGTSWDLAIASLKAAWEITTTTISEVFKVAAAAFSALWMPVISLVAEGWGVVVEFFVSNILPIIKSGWDSLISVGVSAFDYIAKAFDGVINFCNSVFGVIGENWNKIAGFVSDVFASFSKFMKDKFGIDIPAAVSVVTNKVSEIGQSTSNAASEAKQALTDKITAIAQPVLDQAAIAKQNITETVDKESQSVSDSADKNSKATEKTASAVGDYIDKLTELTKKIGGGVVDAVISPASANETPYQGENNSKVSGNTKEAGTAKVSGSQKDMMLGVYNAYKNAGFSDEQAKIMTSQVGRENDFNEKLLFGTHIDPHNKAVNLGMISMQGNRGTALAKYMTERGLMKNGKMEHSQESLNAMAEFQRGEMESGKYKGTQDFLANKNIGYDEGSRITGKNYILWRYDDPKYASHHARQRGYYNKINQLVGDNATSVSVSSKPEQKAIIATPEQAEKAMPKPQSSVMTAQANAVQPTMPNVTPKQPKIPEQPALVLPMTTGAKQAQQPQFLTDIGQDLSDSRLAQIAAPFNGFRAK